MSKTIYTIHINRDDGEGIEVSDSYVERSKVKLKENEGLTNPPDYKIAENIMRSVFIPLDHMNITDDFLTVLVKYGKEGSERKSSMYIDNDD